MRIWPLAAHPGIAVALAAAMQVTAAMAADVERGREMAQRLCAVCHLNPGQGEKQGASDIPGFVAIANRPGQTRAMIVDWLRSRPPMMPDHHLTLAESHALADFIMSLRK